MGSAARSGTRLDGEPIHTRPFAYDNMGMKFGQDRSRLRLTVSRPPGGEPTGQSVALENAVEVTPRKGVGMGPPKLTAEQRAAALEKAAQARRIRAEMKQLLKTGSISFAGLLQRAADDELIAGMKVSAMLAAMPGTGKIKAKRLMESMGIADNRRIRGLGERQRAALLDEFS